MTDDAEYRDKVVDTIARHVGVLNEEMGTVQVDMAAIKIDVGWLKKIALWQLGLLGSLLLGTVCYILFG